MSYSHHYKDKIRVSNPYSNFVKQDTNTVTATQSNHLGGIFLQVRNGKSWAQDNWEIYSDFYQAEITKVQLATLNINPEQKAPHDPSGDLHQTILLRYRITSAQSTFWITLKCT